ncbi:MAG: alcohol dehydrogenase [Candidatus Sericytochromatia bacterium]|nr:MAG: alcohol dehydrogenase [Candidatus Sericytochromatia bacterium]
MKAVRIFEHGNLDVLKITEVEDPKISSNDVLVNVKACALNHLDIWTRKGLPNVKIPLPLILGCDISGIITEVGSEVKSFKIGDEVLVAPGTSCGKCYECLSGQDNLCNSYKMFGYMIDGGYAEYVKVPQENLIKKPNNISFEEGASIPLVFLTAWHMLVNRVKLKAGETILIQAAGSGVGMAGIQVAKLLGARVITTASTDEKLQKAKELGADELINYKEQDFLKEVKRITDKKGVDVVFEHIGGNTFEKSFLSLSKNGRLVTCGATEGSNANIDLRVLFYKHITLYGSFMGQKSELIELIKFFENGKFKSIVDKVLHLEDIKEAHKIIEERRQFGKVVVKP